VAPTLFGISNPSPFIRLSLSIVVMAIAIVGGRWLADLSSQVPSYRVHGSRHGKEDHLPLAPAEKEGSLSRVLGGITFACVGLLGVVVILLIWFSDQTVGKVVDLKTLGQFLTFLGLKVVGSLLVFACMLGFGRLFQRVIESRLIHAHVSRNLVLLAGRLAYFSSLIVGLIVILAIWGTGVVLPVALAGALTVALTLALQDVIRNMVSGVYLLLEHPFVIGDFISLTPYTGQVEDIQIRYTALRTPENQRVLIPNSMLFTLAVVNLSAYAVNRGVVTVTVPDGGEAGLEAVESEIQSGLRAVAEICQDPAPQIIVSGTAEGKLQLQVVFWLPSKDLDTVADLYSQVINQVHTRVEGAEVARSGATAS
jgi:small-conductance mechanosensitive channel